MTALRRIFFCIAVLGIILPVTSPLYATNAKLASNQRKLKRAIGNLTQLEARLTRGEIDEDKRDNYQRKWNGELRDVDKYIGKVRRYGGHASPPSNYKSWDMMAARVNWKTAAEEKAEDRKEAVRKARRYESKAKAYTKRAQQNMKALKSGTISEKAKNNLVVEYRRNRQKVVSNITKANSILKRVNMQKYFLPATTLPARPAITAKIISEEDEAKKDIAKYTRKAKAYIRFARRSARLLSNPQTKYGPTKLASRKREYSIAQRKALRNVAKVNNINTKFGLGSSIADPGLVPIDKLAIKVQQVSDEEYTKEQKEKHFKKLAAIVKKLGQVGKKMRVSDIEKEKKKYASEYKKALKTLKARSIKEFPIPQLLKVKVTPVDDDKAGEEAGIGRWLKKLRDIKKRITQDTGTMTNNEYNSYLSSYRKSYTKVKRDAPEKVAEFPEPNSLVINNQSRLNDEESDEKQARVKKLQDSLRQSVRRLNSKKGILQEEYDEEVANYRRDRKKLHALSPVAAEEFNAQPPVENTVILKPAKLRTKLIKKLEAIRDAVGRGVTQENFNRLQKSFINTKDRLNKLELKHGLPKTTIALGEPKIKDQSTVIKEYEDEIAKIDKEIESAGWFKIGTGQRHRLMKRREQLATLMKKAGHAPPAPPITNRQERKAAAYRSKADKKRKEAEQLKAEGRESEAKKLMQQADILEQDAQHAESSSVNRFFRDKKSERDLTRSDHRKRAASARNEAQLLKGRAKDQQNEADEIIHNAKNLPPEERKAAVKHAEALREQAKETEARAAKAEEKATQEEHFSKSYVERKWIERQERKEEQRKREEEWRMKNGGGGASGAPSISGGGGGMGMPGAVPAAAGVGGAAAVGGAMVGANAAGQPIPQNPEQAVEQKAHEALAGPTPEELERQKALEGLADKIEADADDMDEAEDGDDYDAEDDNWSTAGIGDDDRDLSEFNFNPSEELESRDDVDPALKDIYGDIQARTEELDEREDSNDDDDDYGDFDPYSYEDDADDDSDVYDKPLESQSFNPGVSPPTGPAAAEAA